MLDYSKVRFLWRGDAGRKVSSGRYEKIYDMGPRAATGDATFATAATRPIVDELSDWYGLAVDPAATNLTNYSEQFDNAWWTKIRSSVTANSIASPNGELTADKLIDDATASNSHYVRTNTVSVVSGTSYTASFYVKAAEYSFAYIFFLPDNSAFTSSRAFFNLTTGVVATVDAGVTARITNVGGGWFRIEATRAAGATTASGYIGLGWTPTDGVSSHNGNSVSGIYAVNAQVETGSFATQYKQTVAGTTAYSAVVAPITDAIPVTGTIIVWDNLMNAYAPAVAHRIFDSEDLAGTTLRLYKDLSPNQNRIGVGMHSASVLTSSDLAWQPDNQRKRWFFAMTFNGSTVQVYRGDVQGNFAKVLDVAYTPTTAAIRDMFLHSNAAGGTQAGASFTDIMTYDEVMTAEQIEDIYYGTIPVFQQTAYAGTFVDKFRQKVQAEPASTYDTTLEAEVLADWSTEL